GYTMSELRKKRDQLNYVLNVTPLVKWLFTNGKPSPVNTQDDISYALSRVNEMYDGPYKQKLIEKIQEAQKAYNDAHIFVDPVADQAMEAVKQLFDGDTPKKDNTQEKIDAARKKVEAIKGFDTVKAGLLEKIKVAQAALDDKKQAITVDAYYYGNVYMTGQYSGNIKKFKLTVDGKEYTPGFKLLKNNRFELYIGKKITKGTKTVKVESFDETGKVTGTREITIQTPKLTVENYTLGQEYIKGQTVGEAKQFKLVVDGKEFSAGFKLLENNQFEVYAKNKVQSNSKKVVLKVLNGEGTEIATQEVAVQQPALEVNYYKVNTDYITGTYTGDVKKFKLIVDGQEYFPGFKLLANNQFEVYAKNKVSASSKSITLVSLNAQGKETQRQAVSVINTAIETTLTEATTTVNNLFYGNDENHAKPSNTNAQIDAARKQVNALPDSAQKSVLLKKVEKAQQAYDELMEQWKDVNETMDRFFVNGDIGNPKPDVTTDDIIMLSQKMFVFPIDEEFLEGYTMNELRKKMNQLTYMLNVTPIVKRLFVNGKPSPINTQREITYALGRVNEMYDGPYKQKLIEKIQEAQQAYNAAHHK
ncbi:immunoglobulin-like domain-containing protein, partial [Enterococcus ratti]|uniref:immunoglobulin-like domain-containing protein n=1 Tax=Enterococcus ratti TaxID=150033 RepID=UPI003513DA8D